MVKFELDPPPGEVLELDNWSILDSFLTALMASGASSRTVASYKAGISDFLRFIGDKPLRQVSTGDVLAWRSERVEKGFRKSRRRVHPREKRRFNLITLHYYTLFLRSFFEWLGLNVKVPVVKAPRRGEVSVLKREDVSKLLEASRDLLDVVVVRLLFETGLRASEALNVRVVDVDFSKREIEVKAGKYDVGRTVFFTEELGELLRLWIKISNLKGEDKLIPLSYPGLWKRLKSLASRAGLDPGKVRPHTLRHGFATEALRRGVSVLALQKILGHRDVKITQIYVHLLKDDVKREYLRAFSGRNGLGISTCPTCGEVIPLNSRFCPFCGVQVRELSKPRFEEGI